MIRAGRAPDPFAVRIAPVHTGAVPQLARGGLAEEVIARVAFRKKGIGIHHAGAPP